MNSGWDQNIKEKSPGEEKSFLKYLNDNGLQYLENRSGRVKIDRPEYYK